MYKFDGRDLSQQNKPPSEMQQTCGDQSQDKYERFESWLRENGAQFNLVSIVLRTYTLRNVRLFKDNFCILRLHGYIARL